MNILRKDDSCSHAGALKYKSFHYLRERKLFLICYTSTFHIGLGFVHVWRFMHRIYIIFKVSPWLYHQEIDLKYKDNEMIITLVHLADAVIQSDLQCINGTQFVSM